MAHKKYIKNKALGILLFLGPLLLAGCVNEDSGNNVDSFFDQDKGKSEVSGLQVLVVAGNFQTAAPGQTFAQPLKIQVIENGIPLEGRSVLFTASGFPSATFSPSSATTDTLGLTTVFATADSNAGTVMVEARDVQSGLSATFTLSTVDQGGNTLAALSGNGQNANVGVPHTNPLQVTVTDLATSLPKSNITVRYQVVAGNGRINGSQNLLDVTSNASGIASVTFTAGTTAGNDVIRATLPGSPGPFVDFTLTALVPPSSTVSPSQSTLTVAPSVLSADGVSTTLVTLTARDQYGNAIPAGGATITLAATSGTLLGGVSDNGNGTYTRSLRAPVAVGSGSITVSATVNGTPATSTAQVTLLSGSIDLTTSTVEAADAFLTANGIATSVVTVTLKDSLGNPLTSGGETVVISPTLGAMLGSVVDNDNGTYAQLIKAPTTSGTATISATVNSANIVNTGSVEFRAGAPDLAQSTLTASPSSVIPDGSSTTTITVQLRDQYGNAITTSGGAVTISATAGTWVNAVVDNTDGTYQRVLRAPNAPATASITGTLAGNPFTQSASVYFTNGSGGPDVNTSTVEVANAKVPADGSTTTTITVTLKDASSNPLDSGGANLTITSTAGTLLGTATYIGGGQYTQLLRAGSTATAGVTINASVDGSDFNDTATIDFYGGLSLTTSTLTAIPSTIEANGTATSLIVLQASDVNNVTIPVGGALNLSLATTAGTLLAPLSDNGNGTYSQFLQASGVAETATVSALQGVTSFSDTVDVEFFTPNNLAGSTIDCSNVAGFKNGPLYVASGTLTLNSTGHQGTCPAEFIFTSVIVEAGGVLTHSQTTSTQEYGLQFSAQNIYVANGGTISVAGKGYGKVTTYRFRVPGNTDVQSPSLVDYYIGPSHGGDGGRYTSTNYEPNVSYGSMFEPYTLGAAGSTNYGPGGGDGNGGGRIKITVTTGNLENNGTITANGDNPNACARTGGAGGSVWITTPVLTGTGKITANGGGTGQCIGGGGGRIAVYANSVGGGFAYSASFIANVNAFGGVGNSNYRSGAAGTIYLKRASSTYGDLIVNNNNNATAQYGYTRLVFPVDTTSQAVNATTLTNSGYFSDMYPNGVSPYVGYWLDPNKNQNATVTRTDNQLFKITSATANSLVTGGNMTGVATSGDTFNLVLRLDNLQVTGGAQLADHFNGGKVRIITYQGDVSSGDTTTVTLTGANPSGLEFPGANITYDLTGTSGTIAGPEVTDFTGNVTIANGDMSLSGPLSAQSLTLNNVDLTTSVAKGTTALSLTGALNLTNGANLIQGATTAGTEYALQISAGSANVCATCAIDASGQGFPATGIANTFTSFGLNQVVRWNGAGNALAGGSHGGRGGRYDASRATANTYGSIFSPNSSGSSAGWNWTGYAGGGIIRLILSGNLVADGTISANGQCVAGNVSAGAGGTVYISANTVTGSGTITANGGGGNGCAMNGGAGGGGRIAIYYSALASGFSYPAGVLSKVSAAGGVGINTDRSAAAGTIFLKSASQTYGDLLIDNKGTTSAVAFTPLRFPAPANSVALTATTLTHTGVFGQNIDPSTVASTSYLTGFYVHPNTAENGTPTFADDTLFRVNSLTNNVLTVSGDMTAIAASGNPYRLVMVLDNFEVRGGAVVETEGAVLVREGDISSNDTTSFVIDGELRANGGEVELNGVGSLDISGTGLSLTSLSANAITINPSSALNIAAGNLTTTSDLSVGNSASLSVAAGDLNVTGNLTLGTNAVLSIPAGTLGLTGNFTLNSGSSAAAQEITVGGDMALTGSTVTVSSTGLASSNLTVTGDVSLSSSSLIQPGVTTSANTYRLYLAADDITMDATSQLNANERGYVSVTNSRFRAAGNQDVLNRFNNTNTAASGSHGGQGGEHTTAHISNFTYGSLWEPTELGSSYGYSNHRASGGGAIRVTAGGVFTMNGLVSANGQDCQSTSHYGSGAGGSVWVTAQTLTGTGLMSANGGEATLNSNCTGGGGGRLAIYYTNLAGGYAYPAGVLARVTTLGGQHSNATRSGAPGTIYFKKNTQTYGDLLINGGNRDQGPPFTTFKMPATTTSALVNPTSLIATNSFTNAYSLANEWVGFFLNPNINENVTATLTDDTVFAISANDNSSLTVGAGDMTTVATNGDSFAMQLVFDNFEVKGKGRFDFPSHFIRVLEGDISSNNTTSFVQDGHINADTVDLGTLTNWATTANVGGVVNVECAANRAPCN